MILRKTATSTERERLAQRVANLEEDLFGVMDRNSQLEEENARLREGSTARSSGRGAFVPNSTLCFASTSLAARRF